jgi:hypothetical protein
MIIFYLLSRAMNKRLKKTGLPPEMKRRGIIECQKYEPVSNGGGSV